MAEPDESIVHLAGPACGYGSVWRQRCMWCGALVEEHDLTSVGMLEADRPEERRGKPLTVDDLCWWDGLVSVDDHTSVRVSSAFEPEVGEGGSPIAPERSCMRLFEHLDSHR